MMSLSLFSVLFSAFLSIHGLRRRSLSPSGAIVGFVIGYVFLTFTIHAFPVALLSFYFIGSRATRIGSQRKAQLEQSNSPSDAAAAAGYRTAWQVLSNSLPALLAALLWTAHFVPSSLASHLVHTVPAADAYLNVIRVPYVPYDPTSWCPTSPTIASGLSRALLFAVLGHFACCLGDTLASELGILSTSPPILLTTLRTVPPGTNGAISLGGTIASLLGGATIGTAMTASLLIENTACRRSPLTLAAQLLAWGAFAGGVGSMIDSVLGATVQRTRYSPSSKRILQDDAPASADTKVISGINILSNNQVNLVSSALTSILLAKIA